MNLSGLTNASFLNTKTLNLIFFDRPFLTLKFIGPTKKQIEILEKSINDQLSKSSCLEKLIGMEEFDTFFNSFFTRNYYNKQIEGLKITSNGILRQKLTRINVKSSGSSIAQTKSFLLLKFRKRRIKDLIEDTQRNISKKFLVDILMLFYRIQSYLDVSRNDTMQIGRTKSMSIVKVYETANLNQKIVFGYFKLIERIYYFFPYAENLNKQNGFDIYHIIFFSLYILQSSIQINVFICGILKSKNTPKISAEFDLIILSIKN
ncbi:hypothetical protein BpHYR1_052636 [Brachionus plicatilis]|uniref:Uncharacterized protein n=1 Tax=Brachionus plicatilis TaxID=10195 RepID=A0A3M7S9N4_BRAPC|nr:hypothetical protein BpHYR1_052636 [Brachionus plicatilis]